MKLTIRGKIIGTCSVLLATLAATSALGISRLSDSNERLEHIVSVNAAGARLAAEVRADTIKTTRAERDLLLANSDERRNAAIVVYDQASHERDERRRELRALGDPTIAGKLDELDAALRDRDELHQQVRALKLRASSEHAIALFNTEGHIQSDLVLANLRALEVELAKRTLSPDTLAARGEVWKGNFEVISIGNREKSLLIATTPVEVDTAMKRIAEHNEALKASIAALEQLAATADERRIAAELRASDTKFDEVHGRGTELARENTDGESVVLAQTKGMVLTNLASKIADDVVAAEVASLGSAQQASVTAYGTARALLVGVLALALVLGGVLVTIIVRYLGRVLQSAADLARSVASGDLTQTVEVTNHDEIGSLVTALNEMVENLRTVARQVTTAATNVAAGATTVATGAEEMSATAGQLAEGASQQGAATEQTTAAMEQMGASVQQNADNAQQTDRLASKASTDGQASGQAVAETLSAMKHIAEKIGIIEEIARKTDLLALNAAVEAARAGDHGRGFAVVASEVRKLAERSATAAAEISQLSRSGVLLAEGAGTMLTRLIPDIRKTAELVQEVSAASREQSTGVEQTNKALQALDRVTQQNAAAAEQMAATAGGMAETASELSGQADQLQTAVEFFKLDATNRPVPAIRVPRAVSRRIPRIGGRTSGGKSATNHGAGGKRTAARAASGKSVTDPSANGKLAGGTAAARAGVDLDLGSPGDEELFERTQ